MRTLTGISLLVLSACLGWEISGLTGNETAQAQGVFISGHGASASMIAGSATEPGHADAGAMGDAVLSGLTSPGALSAGRDIDCRVCRVDGNVSAGRNVRLEQSSQVGSIAAGNDVWLANSRVLGSISAGHAITLSQSQVQGSLSTGSEAALQDSSVQGSLSQGGHHLKLDGSTIGQNVYFQGASVSNVSDNAIFNNGSTIVSSGSVTRLHYQRGGSFVRVGTHSLSRVNGYTVQGAEGQTTVITPQQSIYVNGQKVSGEGPKTYAQFQADNPSAPVVEGPGWPDAASTATSGQQEQQSAARHKTTTGQAHPPVQNWLELSGNSQINGQVVFESGYGQVLLHPGSWLNGQVVNGSIQKLPN